MMVMCPTGIMIQLLMNKYFSFVKGAYRQTPKQKSKKIHYLFLCSRSFAKSQFYEWARRIIMTSYCSYLLARVNSMKVLCNKEFDIPVSYHFDFIILLNFNTFEPYIFLLLQVLVRTTKTSLNFHGEALRSRFYITCHFKIHRRVFSNQEE